jgi:hypothetical protein
MESNRPDEVREWKAFHHIDRACELAQLADSDLQAWSGARDLARLHCELAHVKMIGGQRA